MNEELVVSRGDGGRRLDIFLADHLPDLSRSRAQKLIATSAVTVNEAPCGDKNYRLSEGDRVNVTIPPAQVISACPEAIALDIIYEDPDLLVLNKPRGMVVHPAPGHYSGTLVNALLGHCRELSGIGGALRPGIVHRLDKDTSGLLVVAKNDFAHQALSRQLQSRQMRREYLALVHGRVKQRRGKIIAPIGRHPRLRKQMAVVAGGREAISRYSVLAYLGRYTLLRVSLETGRTHQVRVHMAYLGYPVVGDPVYGPRCPEGLPSELREAQALHARRLHFRHPRSGLEMHFLAPLPRELRCGLRALAEEVTSLLVK